MNETLKGISFEWNTILTFRHFTVYSVLDDSPKGNRYIEQLRWFYFRSVIGPENSCHPLDQWDSKQKTNHDLVARAFPPLRLYGCFYPEFSLAVVISLIKFQICKIYQLCRNRSEFQVSRNQNSNPFVCIVPLRCLANHSQLATLDQWLYKSLERKYHKNQENRHVINRIKGVSFWRNCGAASVGEYNSLIKYNQLSW